MRRGIAMTVFAQHARDVREKVRVRLRNQASLPWMKAKELDLLVEVLQRLAPRRCLEWGAGYSTLYFPALLPDLESWHAVEHDRTWFEAVGARNPNPRVVLRWIPPDRGEYLGTRREGTADDFATYIGWPATLAAPFDFILIDGRARVACLGEAFHLISRDGVVALHDANRTAYQGDVPPFRFTRWFTDYRAKRGGLLLASRERDLATVLDVDFHRRLWRRHDQVARLLWMR